MSCFPLSILFLLAGNDLNMGGFKAQGISDCAELVEVGMMITERRITAPQLRMVAYSLLKEQLAAGPTRAEVFVLGASIEQNVNGVLDIPRWYKIQSS